jgi:hypothetical protein
LTAGQNLTLALVSDATLVAYQQLPPAVSDCESHQFLHPLLTQNLGSDIHVIPGQRDDTGTQGYYLPIVFPNEFWNLRSQYNEINSTTPTLPLRITFQPMSYFKFQIFASMSQSFDEAAKNKGSAGAELDEVKRMLVETNPWLLGVTGLVSVLHML